MACLKHGGCKDRHLGFLLRDLSIRAITLSYAYSAVHIPGRRKKHADSLSLFNSQPFFQDVLSEATSSLEVPGILLRQLVSPLDQKWQQLLGIALLLLLLLLIYLK